MKYSPKSWSGFALNKVDLDNPHWELSRRVGEWTLDLRWRNDEITFWLFAHGDKYRVFIDKEDWAEWTMDYVEHDEDPPLHIRAWEQESIPAEVDMGLDGSLTITGNELLEVWQSICCLVRPLPH